MKSAQWTIGLVVVGALAVSCNALTGLSDYEKVACVGPCGDAGDAGTDVVPDVAFDVDAGNDVASDVADEDALDADVVDTDVVDADVSDADVVTYDAMELGPVDPMLRWARWPMPHRDDAGDATIVDSGAGGFLDLVTGLEWSKSYVKMTLGGAEGQCSGEGGRLPTRIELVSLLEPGLISPYDPALTDTESGPYWTASEVFDPNATQQLFWVVDFDTGALGQLNPSEEAYVRCIVE